MTAHDRYAVLTHVGPGTPTGKYMRHFWHPVAASVEVRDDPVRVKQYSKMNRYHVSITAYLLDKLKKINDGDGTLLDRTLLYQGSNMGNSNRHAHERVPVILVGGAAGLKGNMHYLFPEGKERTSNLLLTLLKRFEIGRAHV